MKQPPRRTFTLHLPNGTTQTLEADLTVTDDTGAVTFHLERIKDVTNAIPKTERSRYCPTKKTPH